jgi:periplasmic protein TonB
MSELARKHEPMDADSEGHVRVASTGHASAPAPGGARGPRDLGAPVDPVAAILGPRETAGVDWFYGSVAAALLLHAGMLGSAASSFYLHDLRSLMQQARSDLHEFFWAQYDVDLTPKDKPKEPPKEEAPKDPEPPPLAPKAQAPKPKEDDPYDHPPPPPTPAQAAKVLTQKEDPDKIEDLTGNTVVSGDGTAAYGQQSASGTGDKPVTNPHASLNGVPGGTGTGAAATPAPQAAAPDRSQPARLEGGTSWSCPFPPEADVDQIDEALATIVVTVRPDNSVLSVTVVKDPGHGFGRAARMCALGRHFSAGLDRSGAKITATTPPLVIRFSR